MFDVIVWHCITAHRWERSRSLTCVVNAGDETGNHTPVLSPFFIDEAVKRCVMQEVDIFPVEPDLVF